MPGGDRTGPLGHGPMTGRAAGFCAGNQSPGYSYFRHGRGFGRARGRSFRRGFWGRGRGVWYNEYENIPVSGPSQKEEKAHLESLAKDLEDELENIKKRIQNLSTEEKK